MVKKIAVSNEWYDSIMDCRRYMEKKENKWIPLSRMKDIKVVPKFPLETKKKNERNIFEF